MPVEQPGIRIKTIAYLGGITLEAAAADISDLCIKIFPKQTVCPSQVPMFLLLLE